MSQIAQRYSQALFELATQTDSLGEVEEGLKRFYHLLTSSPELTFFLKSKRFSKNEQTQVLRTLFEKLHVHDLVKKFILLIVKKGRISFIKEMIAGFSTQTLHYTQTSYVKLATAKSLTEKELSEMKKMLEDKLNKKVILEHSVEQDLLEGLTLKIGSFLIDDSAKTRLTRLYNIMRGIN